MALPSIRRRLSLSLLGVSLAGVLGMAAAVSWVVRHEVQEVMDDTLVESAELLHNTLAWARPAVPAAGLTGSALPSPQHEEHVVWQWLDAQGRVVLHSHRAPEQPLVTGLRSGFMDVTQSWRVHAMPLAFEPGTLLVAQPQLERDEAILDSVRYVVGAAFAIWVACAAWLGWRVRRELQPLVRLSQAVGRFDPIEADSRLQPAERAELAPMHAAIEQLGSRLNERVRREQAFAAHAAHALRTPLSGLVLQLKVAERHSTADGRAALALARSAADRLGRVVSALLALFRSGHELQPRDVDLAALVRELPATGLTVEVGPAPRFRADADLLAAALANLIDNAQRHGARRLHLGVEVEGHTVRLVLQDDGPGIGTERRTALQAALDDPQEQGCGGLGLKMADWVARAHGGRLRLLPCPAGCRIEMTIAVSARGRAP